MSGAGEDLRDYISQGDDMSIAAAKWPVMAIALVSLILGVGVGVTVGRSAAGEAYPGDGGVVYACNGKALALVHASGLVDSEMEVQFPLRGDGVLLPITADGVEVLAGRVTGHQYYRPVDGQLALARGVGVPHGDSLEALVGSRRVSVRVERCDTP